MKFYLYGAGHNTACGLAASLFDYPEHFCRGDDEWLGREMFSVPGYKERISATPGIKRYLVKNDILRVGKRFVRWNAIEENSVILYCRYYVPDCISIETKMFPGKDLFVFCDDFFVEHGFYASVKNFTQDLDCRRIIMLCEQRGDDDVRIYDCVDAHGSLPHSCKRYLPVDVVKAHALEAVLPCLLPELIECPAAIVEAHLFALRIDRLLDVISDCIGYGCSPLFEYPGDRLHDCVLNSYLYRCHNKAPCNPYSLIIGRTAEKINDFPIMEVT